MNIQLMVKRDDLEPNFYCRCRMCRKYEPINSAGKAKFRRRMRHKTKNKDRHDFVEHRWEDM